MTPIPGLLDFYKMYKAWGVTELKQGNDYDRRYVKVNGKQLKTDLSGLVKLQP